MSAFYYYQLLMPTGRAKTGIAAISVEMDASARLWLEKNHDGIVLQLYRLPAWASDVLQTGRRLFRGASYTVLDDGSVAAELEQAAIGAPYAHTTAPLRRLVDRYVLAHCEAIANEHEIPAWAADGLAGLPEIM